MDGLPADDLLLAKAGAVIDTIITAISAAAARTKIMRLNNVPPHFSSVATVIVVSLCPVIFFLLFRLRGRGRDSVCPVLFLCVTDTLRL